MNKNRPETQNPGNAEYQRDYAKRKKAQKAARFKKLVKMAEPLKEALNKYRPGNQPPKPPTKQQQPGAGLVNNPAQQQPQRKRWILGVD